MIFKQPSLLTEFTGLNALLQAMALDMDAFARSADMPELICTRILELVPGSSGVHEDHRALDFRDEHAGEFRYSLSQRTDLLNYMNSRYPRIDKRPTLMWHSFQGMPHHLHLQIARSVMDYGPSTKIEFNS